MPVSESTIATSEPQAGELDAGVYASALFELLDDDDLVVQTEALQALPWLAEEPGMPEELSAGLVERAFDPARGDAGCEGMAGLIAALGGAGRTDELLEALARECAHGRTAAARALGWRGNEAAIEALATVLDDPVEAVRLAAVEALAGIGGEIAERLLLAVALGEGSAAVREAAVQGVRGFAGEDAERVLLAVLRTDTADLRLCALVSLRALDELESVVAVAGCLADADARVRLLALSVLEQHGTGADTERVRALCDDDDPRVRRMAVDTVRVLLGGS